MLGGVGGGVLMQLAVVVAAGHGDGGSAVPWVVPGSRGLQGVVMGEQRGHVLCHTQLRVSFLPTTGRGCTVVPTTVG